MSIGGPGFSIPGQETSFLQGVLQAFSYCFQEKSCPARGFHPGMNFPHLLPGVLLHPVPENQIPMLAYHREKRGYHS